MDELRDPQDDSCAMFMHIRFVLFKRFGQAVAASGWPAGGAVPAQIYLWVSANLGWGVFASKGIDASLIDDFIAAAGVARGTFYNYFKTTTELLDAVTAELSDQVLASIDLHVSRIDDPIERVATGCLLYMQAAVNHPAWGDFIIQTGIRRGASGQLIDEYLPVDLTLAKNSGQASFPSVRAARDVVLGGIRAGIESVLSGDVPQDHIRDMMQITLTALGVSRTLCKKLSLLELPQLELPPALKPLA